MDELFNDPLPSDGAVTFIYLQQMLLKENKRPESLDSFVHASWIVSSQECVPNEYNISVEKKQKLKVKPPSDDLVRLEHLLNECTMKIFDRCTESSKSEKVPGNADRDVVEKIQNCEDTSQKHVPNISKLLSSKRNRSNNDEKESDAPIINRANHSENHAKPTNAGGGTGRILSSVRSFQSDNKNNTKRFRSNPTENRSYQIQEDNIVVDSNENEEAPNGFISARTKYLEDNRQNPTFRNNANNHDNEPQRRPAQRRGFVPPAPMGEPSASATSRGSRAPASNGRASYHAGKAIMNAVSGANNGAKDASTSQLDLDIQNDQRLQGLDEELIKRIQSEVVQIGDPVTFDDIAGLKFAKENIEEIVVWPLKNPEYYTGLRQLPKGLLLFGPPGTGKTLIGKAIASEVKATFFSISASSLTSKWIGEGEKMMRALFGVAAVMQPSVVFIDEIDSLLCKRSADENEASRRLKTEFLVQIDGAATRMDDMVLVIGATNRPEELDEAARRRFVKRLYIPLPDSETRRSLIDKLLNRNENDLSEEERKTVCQLTDGYSGADVTNLAREAAMGPLRDKMRHGRDSSSLRPIHFHDFEVALQSIRASVSQKDLAGYVAWNNEFGTQEYKNAP